MDIKLRAKLSAYSKIESINDLSSNTPVPDALAAGSVLGVNNTGNYTLFPKVSNEDIDELFYDVATDDVVTKDDIDTLFEEKEVVTSVSKNEIDTLFETKEDAKPVSKDEIDTLFKQESDPIISTVSFADIDSLFK